MSQTIVFDALLTTAHRHARRVLDKMRGSYASDAYSKNVVKLQPQETLQVGTTDLLVVQFDSTLGDVCEVGWTQQPGNVAVRQRVQQLLVIDAPLAGVYVKNLTPAESTTHIVVKIVTSKK